MDPSVRLGEAFRGTVPFLLSGFVLLAIILTVPGSLPVARWIGVACHRDQAAGGPPPGGDHCMGSDESEFR